MDKFLEIVYQLHYEKKVSEDVIGTLLQPMREMLNEKIKDEEIVVEVMEELTDCLCKARNHFAVDGMKLAVDVMTNKYTPTI